MQKFSNQDPPCGKLNTFISANYNTSHVKLIMSVH